MVSGLTDPPSTVPVTVASSILTFDLLPELGDTFPRPINIVESNRTISRNKIAVGIEISLQIIVFVRRVDIDEIHTPFFGGVYDFGKRFRVVRIAVNRNYICVRVKISEIFS